jgi:hypothetical protein
MVIGTSWIVGHLPVQGGRGRHADVVDEQRVAVGCRLGDLGGAQRSAGATDVVDDDGLALELLRQRDTEVAGDLVGGTAGSKRHDDADGLVGIGLDGDGHGDRGQGGEDLLHRDLQRWEQQGSGRLRTYKPSGSVGAGQHATRMRTPATATRGINRTFAHPR